MVVPFNRNGSSYLVLVDKNDDGTLSIDTKLNIHNK
jgi:hypothetical protein